VTRWLETNAGSPVRVVCERNDADGRKLDRLRTSLPPCHPAIPPPSTAYVRAIALEIELMFWYHT
jgi:hypothetical protein